MCDYESMRKTASPDSPMSAIAPYGLRLPPDLKSELETYARANGRSLNSEIIARLQVGIGDSGRTGKGMNFMRKAQEISTPDTVPWERIGNLERAVIDLIGRVSMIDGRGDQIADGGTSRVQHDDD